MIPRKAARKTTTCVLDEVTNGLRNRMWLISINNEIRVHVCVYFQNPVAYSSIYCRFYSICDTLIRRRKVTNHRRYSTLSLCVFVSCLSKRNEHERVYNVYWCGFDDFWKTKQIILTLKFMLRKREWHFPLHGCQGWQHASLNHIVYNMLTFVQSMMDV